jgi:hypothetical protein
VAGDAGTRPDTAGGKELAEEWIGAAADDLGDTGSADDFTDAGSAGVEDAGGFRRRERLADMASLLQKTNRIWMTLIHWMAARPSTQPMVVYHHTLCKKLFLSLSTISNLLIFVKRFFYCG